jgi:hypothetical protein
MNTSRIVRCLLPSPHPVAPPVQDAPPREGLVEVPLADRPAHAARVLLVLAHPPIVAAAVPALRGAPRPVRRATAPNVASIVLPTRVVPPLGPVGASPRQVAHRVHRVGARTAIAKESSVPLVATIVMIVSSAMSVARAPCAPRAPGAAVPVLKAVTRVEAIARHAVARVVPTPATPGLAPREAKASAVPTTATHARVVVPPVEAPRAHRESRVVAVPSTPIAPSVLVARFRPVRAAIPEPAPDARRAN